VMKSTGDARRWAELQRGISSVRRCLARKEERGSGEESEGDL
jgi:hypothetical protein